MTGIVPGFFAGDATNLEDLICFWNLRAANVALSFVDSNHAPRYTTIIPEWEKWIREMVAGRHEWDRHVSVWSRRDNMEELLKPFGEMRLTRCRVSAPLWNGKKSTRAYDAFRRNIRAWGNNKRKRETQSVLRIER